jgi:hypothetical protein
MSNGGDVGVGGSDAVGAVVVDIGGGGGSGTGLEGAPERVGERDKEDRPLVVGAVCLVGAWGWVWRLTRDELADAFDDERTLELDGVEVAECFLCTDLGLTAVEEVDEPPALMMVEPCR